MTRRDAVVSCAVALWATGTAVGGFIQVRDEIGGVSADGLPGGFYLDGTGSEPVTSLDGADPLEFFMGAFAFECDDGSGFVPFKTFCTEPLQDVTFGPNPPDDVGLPFEELSLLAAGFTGAEEDILEILWANALAQSLVDELAAAAFQSIIWEVAQDDVVDLESGDFWLRDGASMNDYTEQVLDLANTWLANISGGTWTVRTDLLVLHHPDSQDVLKVVPTPGAVALCALGVISIQRRRR